MPVSVRENFKNIKFVGYLYFSDNLTQQFTTEQSTTKPIFGQTKCVKDILAPPLARLDNF